MNLEELEELFEKENETLVLPDLLLIVEPGIRAVINSFKVDYLLHGKPDSEIIWNHLRWLQINQNITMFYRWINPKTKLYVGFDIVLPDGKMFNYKILYE